MKLAEIVAAAATLFGIGVPVFVPFVYETRSVHHDPRARIINLTAVSETGTWTQEDVSGQNYWRRKFPDVRLILNMGQPTVIRLKSADVIHTMYIPELGIGPVEVYPGRVAEIKLTPAKEGTFPYYCTTVCGLPHFGMRGEIVVQGKQAPARAASLHSEGKYWLEPSPKSGASLVERGKWLFSQKGCSNCHGVRGRGGIGNWNYVNGTVPALNTMAERLMLFEPEDVRAIVEQMEHGKGLETLTDSPPVPRFSAVLAQYRAVRKVITDGSVPGKKDPHGLAPPLEMPAWGPRLTASDIDALIAYLLTLKSGA